MKVWRPFQRLYFKYNNRHSSINSSVIHTFGTFILLSYGKNLFVSFTLVQGCNQAKLDIATNTLKSVPLSSVDLSVPYFSATHAPYVALGLFGGVITIILPLVLVLIYPTRVFPKLIRCCGLRRWHVLRTFMEVFVGSYKDGTEGTRDYRLTAALYLFGRVIVGVSWSISKCGVNNELVQYYGWLMIAVPYILFAVAFALFKPHRKCSHNVVDVFLLLLIAKICICLHIVFGSSLTDHNLRIMVLVILIDVALPQITVLIYFSIKLTSWACSQRLVRKDVDDTLPQIQKSKDESQPLLHP